MKQKMIFNLFLLTCFAFTVYGQKVDYNKIIIPESATNLTFEEKLVQIAYRNNPSGLAIQKEAKIAAYDYKSARLQWTSLFGVNGNLNEFSIKRFGNSETTTTGNQFFPRYNVYLHLPFSTFKDLPHEKRVARENTAIAEDRLNAYKLELRARVLRLYASYQMAETVAQIRTTSANDEQDIFSTVETQFKKGAVTLDAYESARRSNNDAKIQKAQADLIFKQAKIDLEEVLGIKMEEIR